MHAWYEKEAAHEEAKRVVRALSRELAVVRAELKESRAHAAQVRQDRGHNRQRLHVVEDRAERLESKLRVAIADRDAQLQKRKHAEARAKALAGLAQPQVSPEVVEKIEKDARRLIDGEYVSVASIISHAAISLHSVACAAHRMTTLENEVQMWNSMPCLWGNGRYCLSSGGQANVIALSHVGQQRALKVFRESGPWLANEREMYDRLARSAQPWVQHIVPLRETGFLPCGCGAGHVVHSYELYDSDVNGIVPRCDVFDALVVYRDTLQGLFALHNTGLLHGDVKPNNILVRFGNDQKPVMCCLSDVGGHPNTESVQYQTGDWLPAERTRSEDGRLDGRGDDVYAAALVLVACATGRSQAARAAVDAGTLSYLLIQEARMPPGATPEQQRTLLEGLVDAATSVLEAPADQRAVAATALTPLLGVIGRCKQQGIQFRA